MNEILFFLHICVLLGFLFIAIRLGKSALYIAFAVQLIAANLFVSKQIALFSLSVTGTDVFTIGSLFTLTALVENYGKQAARKAIWTGFFFLIFFGVMGEIHNYYAPSVYDKMHVAFREIFSAIPRVMIVSLIAAFISDRCDLVFYSRLKKKFSLAIAFVFAALFSQLLDTAIFTYGALGGTMEVLGHIFIFSYLIKCLSIALIAPFTALITRWKPREI